MHNIIRAESIQHKIYHIRGVAVMLDSDLAQLYDVETKVFNQAVKRNEERFPEAFRFQLTLEELNSLRSQIVTSNTRGGRRYLPYAFTEQGVAMLSAVLRSPTAIQISIQIINAFVEMRKLVLSNDILYQKINNLEKKQISYEVKTDERFEKIFSALEDNQPEHKQGIFYDGQIFDAYVFISQLIKKAKKEIILIDNYIDESVLTHLSKANLDVKITILTKNISNRLKLDVDKYNQQYRNITLKSLESAHDRFLIIDKAIYHIGASIKDLGKKWFAFSKLDSQSLDLLEKLKVLI
ncbi:ORF6N domain-containing protein [Legionella gresilensis]|uniref:ORF6N domain-containing protein n=1 Tax=Legionella gresilensis TaxID=91823 RepID=UPI001A951BEC|nr:ORF6N domain-containing protein [Legionella gresilensis]